MNKPLKLFVIWMLTVCLVAFLAACSGKGSGTETQGTVTDPTDTQPAQTEGMVTDRPTFSTEPQQETQPQQETVPTTQPGTTPETEPQTPAGDASLSMNYQQYMNLNSVQQQAFFDQYFADDPLAFADWFRKIKAEYDDEIPEIIATGPVDIGDYINP